MVGRRAMDRSDSQRRGRHNRKHQLQRGPGNVFCNRCSLRFSLRFRGNFALKKMGAKTPKPRRFDAQIVYTF